MKDLIRRLEEGVRDDARIDLIKEDPYAFAILTALVKVRRVGATGYYGGLDHGEVWTKLNYDIRNYPKFVQDTFKDINKSDAKAAIDVLVRQGLAEIKERAVTKEEPVYGDGRFGPVTSYETKTTVHATLVPTAKGRNVANIKLSKYTDMDVITVLAALPWGSRGENKKVKWESKGKTISIEAVDPKFRSKAGASKRFISSSASILGHIVDMPPNKIRAVLAKIMKGGFNAVISDESYEKFSRDWDDNLRSHGWVPKIKIKMD